MTPDDIILSPWVYPLRSGETLSSNEWIEWQFHRFLSSRFLAYAVAEDRRADIGTALILWSECYRQDPAGTLPDDDVELAALARFASIAEWQAVRAGVLYGWEPCLVIDEHGLERPGRLGHTVIAHVADASFRRKRGRAQGREAAKLAQTKHRVKLQLVRMKRLALSENKQLVAVIAQYLMQSDLYASEDNVIAALETEVGVPRVVDGGFGQRPR